MRLGMRTEWQQLGCATAAVLNSSGSTPPGVTTIAPIPQPPYPLPRLPTSAIAEGPGLAQLDAVRSPESASGLAEELGAGEWRDCILELPRAHSRGYGWPTMPATGNGMRLGMRTKWLQLGCATAAVRQPPDSL